MFPHEIRINISIVNSKNMYRMILILHFNQAIQRIQVECLTASVVVFVVTVELIALRSKMTDVARQK